MTETFLTIEKQVHLKPYVAREFKSYELASREEMIVEAGGYLIVDTENYQNYFLVAFKNIKTKKYFTFEIREEYTTDFDPKFLSWILHNYTTVGFNSIKYDIPLLWAAFYHQSLEIIKSASNDLINGVFTNEFKQRYQIEIFSTKHVDLIEVCPLFGSLKLYGARLHAKRIQDLPFNPYGKLTNEEITIVKDYCINDLDTTELLLDNLSEQLQLREKLTIEYKQDLMSKSDAQIAETVISSELKRLTGKWPKKPAIEDLNFKFKVPNNLFFQTPYMQNILQIVANNNFGLDEYGRLERNNEIKNLKIKLGNSIYRMGIGGLHSSEEVVSYVSDDNYQIFDRDVASYYPTIVLNCGLFPQHLGENFLKVYQGLVERRIAAKKAKNIAVSENLKVTINGTFGKTGSPHSVLYAPEMTVQITVGGQLYLLMLIEALELCYIPVVSANTDGIIMYCHKELINTYLNVVKWWEQATGFTTEETKYKAIYSRDVNCYIAIESEDKVKGKNALYDPWRGKSAKDAYWRFQKNPNMQICVEAVEQYLTKNVSIDQTIRNCRDITKFVCVRNVTGGAHKNREYLGKTIRWYYANDAIGTINYIKSGNKVPDTDGATPLMDLLDNFPTNINYQLYINKAVEMLYEIGALKAPQQERLF